MARVTQADLETLFTRVDKNLTKHTDLFVIGGAAAIIGYNVTKFTEDIDLESDVDPSLAEMVKEEAQKMGLGLYLSFKGIFFPPYGYRDRMKFCDFPEKKLRVYYLNQYDLAISKIDRGIQKDMDDIQAIHERFPFELEILLQIFNEEYITTASIGNPREKKMNLLDVIEKLFGIEAMKASKASIGF